jgi:putative transposase
MAREFISFGSASKLVSQITISRMWSKPVRYQNQHCLHFITFSCHRRMQLLGSAHARDVFERELERVRKWYGICVVGYVAMPEHVHLLIGEPERNELSIAIQMLKQITSRKLRPKNLPQFWQVRYYGFPVWTEKKRIEKLRYIHRNPVRRGLVRRPEGWRWSSFVHYATGAEAVVEIESQWTARTREKMGITPTVAIAHPSPKSGERVGQPRVLEFVL